MSTHKSRSRGRKREAAKRRAIERLSQPRYFGNRVLTVDDLLLIRKAVLRDWYVPANVKPANVKPAIVDDLMRTALGDESPVGVQLLAIEVILCIDRKRTQALENYMNSSPLSNDRSDENYEVSP